MGFWGQQSWPGVWCHRKRMQPQPQPREAHLLAKPPSARALPSTRRPPVVPDDQAPRTAAQQRNAPGPRLSGSVPNTPALREEFPIREIPKGGRREKQNGLQARKNNVKLIQIEFNWHHLFTNNTINQFSEILDNYVVTQMNLINGKLIVVDKNHYFSNIFQLSNFIFVEKEFFIENKNNLLN